MLFSDIHVYIVSTYYSQYIDGNKAACSPRNAKGVHIRPN